MDLVLVGGRCRDPQEAAAAVASAAALARGLAERGHRLRWVQPVLAGERPPALPAGVTWLPVESTPPPFRQIEQGLGDVPTETRLSHTIRAALPDVVHVLAFGGVNSAATAWIAERLGVPAVVSLRAADLLCASGTLADERDHDCLHWDSPERCLQCCATSFHGGLTPHQQRWARRLRFLGGWSPYPDAVAFQNRLEVLLGGVASADLVLVSDEAQRELLASAGVPYAKLRVVGDPDAARFEAIYREVQAATRRPA